MAKRVAVPTGRREMDPTKWAAHTAASTSGMWVVPRAGVITSYLTVLL